MKAVLLVTLLSMGSVSAEGCVSCLGALAKTAELVDTLASVDDAERQRALERKVVLLEEEQAVRAELSRVRQQADRLERAREARAVRAAAPAALMSLWEISAPVGSVTRRSRSASPSQRRVTRKKDARTGEARTITDRALRGPKRPASSTARAYSS